MPCLVLVDADAEIDPVGGLVGDVGFGQAEDRVARQLFDWAKGDVLMGHGVLEFRSSALVSANRAQKASRFFERPAPELCKPV